MQTHRWDIADAAAERSIKAGTLDSELPTVGELAGGVARGDAYAGGQMGGGGGAPDQVKCTPGYGCWCIIWSVGGLAEQCVGMEGRVCREFRGWVWTRFVVVTKCFASLSVMCWLGQN